MGLRVRPRSLSLFGFSATENSTDGRENSAQKKIFWFLAHPVEKRYPPRAFTWPASSLTTSKPASVTSSQQPPFSRSKTRFALSVAGKV